MAIASGGTLGTGTSSTSGTSFTLTTATNTLAAGNAALLTVVTDNTGTGDSNYNEHTGVSGGAGTWTKLGEYTNGQRVTAYGADTADSGGVAHTHGNNAYATTTQISAAVANPIKYLQLGVDLAQDTSGATKRGLIRIARIRAG